MRTNRIPFLVALLLIVLVACSGVDAGMPTPALSVDEIETLEQRALDYGRERVEAWPDVDAFLADHADDVTFADPTFGDIQTGRDGLVGTLKNWALVTDYEIDVDGTFFSVDGAAFQEAWPGLSRPPGANPSPGNPPPEVQSGMDVYRFEGDEVTGSAIWYRAEDMDAYNIGCFDGDGCAAMESTIEAYTTAWSDRDTDAVAKLYHDDARFIDGVLGLNASGPTEIGALAEPRFGPSGDVTIEVLDRYAWTRDGLLGVAIHYEATVDGVGETQEAVTTLHLGELGETGFEPDPDGLIHLEKVLHRTGSFDWWKQDVSAAINGGAD